ncbi:MAG: VIT1/CCC1 transporter family protein [Ligilactobacillus salivarius]|nr:VIT1/CCC1 transporter family protein [Ligilactobacillus salivarius]
MQKNDILMPFHAAASSFCSFIIGAMIPLLTMILARPEHRVVFTLIAMIASLSINAVVCTHNSEVSTSKTILRNVITGLLTTLVTFILGASV